MSDTSASLKAARDAEAEKITPELYRQASEWFLKSRREYRLKNFDLARRYAEKARGLAERAEWESRFARAGGEDIHTAPPDPNAEPPSSMTTPDSSAAPGAPPPPPPMN